MSLCDIAGLVRYHERAARRFVCRAPTVATVLLATGLYAREWYAFSRSVAHSPGLLDAGTWRASLLAILTEQPDERAGRVLRSCVTVVGGQPGDLERLCRTEPGLAVDLAMECLLLTDARRAFEGAGGPAIGAIPLEDVEALPDEDWDQQARDASQGVLLTLHSLARQYGAGSPQAVASWPFETFLDACDLAPLLNPRPATRADAGEVNQQASGLLNMNAVAMRFPGIGYVKE